MPRKFDIKKYKKLPYEEQWRILCEVRRKDVERQRRRLEETTLLGEVETVPLPRRRKKPGMGSVVEGNHKKKLCGDGERDGETKENNETREQDARGSNEDDSGLVGDS